MTNRPPPGLLGRLEHEAAHEIVLLERRAVQRHLLPHGFLRAATTRLRTLPPFRLAVVLTVTTGLPVSVFALPVAGAQIGAPATLVVLLVVGAGVTLTMAAVAEAVSRSVSVRYDGGFLGRLFADLLGRRASGVFTPLTALRTSLSLLATWIALSLSLATVTGVPREAWAIAAGVLILATLARGSAAGFTTVALAGTVSAVLLVVVALIALTALGEGDLVRSAGRTSTAEALGAVAGVTVMQFIGTVYVVGVGRSVLPADPSGAALIRGSAVGTAVVTALSALWLVAVAGAVPPGVLLDERGTGLAQLAEAGGPAVTVLGTALAVLLLGLGTQRQAMAVYAFARERLDHPWAAGIPVVALFALAEMLLGLGDVSFSDLVTVAGVLTNFAVAGVIPLLLAAATRRKGELPVSGAVGLAGRPAVVIGGCAVCIVALGFFAVAGFADPVPRLGALIVGVGLLAGCMALVRAGTFAPRVVLGLLCEGPSRRLFALAATRPFGPGGDGRRKFTGDQAWALEVWGREIGPDGRAGPLPARVELRRGDAAPQRSDLTLTGGDAFLPAGPGDWTARFAPVHAGRDDRA